MRRIAIVGNSGSGKSMLARRLADGLGLAHVDGNYGAVRDPWSGTVPTRASADRSAWHVEAVHLRSVAAVRRWLADALRASRRR